MSYVLVTLAALLASCATFFTGFGLGTVLLPVLALFMPIEAAVGATALVHLINNLFKVALLGKDADRQITPRFALFSAVGALAGAGALGLLTRTGVLASYTLGGHGHEVSVLKLIIGALMILFALVEFLPALQRLSFPRSLLWVGGVTSGFFGGLSGHQGALRSAFLARTGMTKEAFIGTRAVCAVAVDASRLLVYGALAFFAARAASSPHGAPGETPTSAVAHAQTLPPPKEAAFLTAFSLDHGAWGLIGAGVVGALLGTWLGRRLIHKTTMDSLRITIGVALALLGVAITVGLV